MLELDVGDEFIIHWSYFRYKKALAYIEYNSEKDELELKIKLK